MEEMFENKLLDDLYNIRGEKFEINYMKYYGKKKEIKKSEIAEKNFNQTINKLIKDETIIETIRKKFGDFTDSVLEEMFFWNREFYKLGFLDGINFKNEIRRLKEKMSCKNEDTSEIDTFFYTCADNLLDYIEREKSKRLAKREDYKELTKKKAEIKKQYPKVRSFIEDEETEILNLNELKAVLEIIDIEYNIMGLEVEEAFKLGLKENEAL